MGESSPLDPDSEAAVLTAARQLLVAHWAAHDLNQHAVAERAGVEAARVYLRWPDMHRLIADSIEPPHLIADIPDLGDSRAELKLALQHLIVAYTSRPAIERIALSLSLRQVHDDDAIAMVRDEGERTWRGAMLAALQRATARGDLAPDVDAEAIIDIWAGAVAYRRIFRGGVVDSSFQDVLLDLVLAGRVPLAAPEPMDPMPDEWWQPPLVDAVRWLTEVQVGRMFRVADGVPVGVLAQAPAHRIQMGEFGVAVTGGAHRDFMPIVTEARTRMSAGVMVEAEGSGVLPRYLRADRIVVLYGDEAWVAPLEEAEGFRTSRSFRAGAGQGPLWPADAIVEIVVSLSTPGRRTWLVRVPGVRITHSA
ncbi:TetR-like C-terminal domain-containing protein [Actinoplanes subglobosus]|uniref:TetR-like C-terminal domain-containing protein n=1 Tax=Actinoplanes subglobosus TaxID=1547892 RepID=A0ABV8J0W1_9ACTN